MPNPLHDSTTEGEMGHNKKEMAADNRVPEHPLPGEEDIASTSGGTDACTVELAIGEDDNDEAQAIDATIAISPSHVDVPHQEQISKTVIITSKHVQGRCQPPRELIPLFDDLHTKERPRPPRNEEVECSWDLHSRSGRRYCLPPRGYARELQSTSLDGDWPRK